MIVDTEIRLNRILGTSSFATLRKASSWEYKTKILKYYGSLKCAKSNLFNPNSPGILEQGAEELLMEQNPPGSNHVIASVKYISN